MAEPVLEVRGLAKAFGALRATDDVSLTLGAGEIHALIGPNGAGKSTLIRLVTGELAPDAGEIRFEGRRIDALDAAARARAGLARSFQVSALAPELTALQNVMLAVLAREGGAFGFFRRALGEARLTGPAAEHLAEVGLGARAGTPAADLSHGERRRLEIAIALALRPRVFLLDEPMAGIGHDGAAEITALLARLRSRAPILLVEHDMDAVFTLADRITVLVAGRAIATGTVAEIRADREVQRAYLGEEA